MPENNEVIRPKSLATAKNQTDRQRDKKIFFKKIEMVVFALQLLLFRDTKNTVISL